MPLQLNSVYPQSKMNELRYACREPDSAEIVAPPINLKPIVVTQGTAPPGGVDGQQP